MLNRIILIGRLTRDPEMRYTTTGKAVTNFSLAVDRGFTSPSGEKEVDFIDIVAWERQAEVVANYLKKGRLAGVEGRLQIRQFEHEGQKRRAAEVVASRVVILEWGDRTGGDGGSFGGGGGGDSFGGGRDFGTDIGRPDDDIPF